MSENNWVVEAKSVLSYLLDKQDELKDHIEQFLDAIEQEDEARCERLVAEIASD